MCISLFFYFSICIFYLLIFRPVLKQSIVGVFIANEENGTFKGIGVDQLSLEGYLDDLKRGPVS